MRSGLIDDAELIRFRVCSLDFLGPVPVITREIRPELSAQLWFLIMTVSLKVFVFCCTVQGG